MPDHTSPAAPAKCLTHLQAAATHGDQVSCTDRGPALRVVIIGGGFAGVCTAVQLLRATQHALAICIVEPRAALGQGQAYSTTDPDHRLNAPSFVHSIHADDAWHIDRWCAANRILDEDPQARWSDGAVYLRRSSYARYLADSLHQQLAQTQARGIAASLEHLQAQAVALSPTQARSAADGIDLQADQGWHVTLNNGATLIADLVVIATGNPPQQAPAMLQPWADAPGVISNAFDPQKLATIAPSTQLVVLGAGLTTQDLLVSLLRRGHHGPITVLSRHGLQPRPLGPLPLALRQAFAAGVALPGGVLLDRLNSPPPAFITHTCEPPNLRRWLRALRLRSAELTAAGDSWYTAFDELRDSVWQLWPSLPLQQQRRMLRLLRTWYDVHRYRTVPHTEAAIRQAQAQGLVRMLAGRVLAIEPGTQASTGVAGAPKPWTIHWQHAGQAGQMHADVIVSCTGLDFAANVRHNPLLAQACAAGCLQPDALQLGLNVDARGCAIDAQGRPQPSLRIVGPPTLGSYGDPIGAMFIAAHIFRAAPDMLAACGRSTSSPAPSPQPYVR